MDVLKVELEGITCSFRYPHFMQGKQPTFEMPPPATIYGHICSALGDWIDPQGLLVGYNFSYDAKGEDLEHVHVLKAKNPTAKNPIVAEGNVNPFKREILFKPKLTLYINKPDYYDAFKSPVYPVILGRSQDLACYTSVKTITLKESTNVYFQDTLLPFSMHKHICKGYFCLMPRYLDYANSRVPTFDEYLVIKKPFTKQNILTMGEPLSFYIDETEPLYKDHFRGVFMHSIVE